MATMFGQVVLGPPGSGKSTYCVAMAALLKEMGRKVGIFNLDPANDSLPYTPALDIRELVVLEDVMNTYNLGPNGSLVFCMELLEKNMSWMTNKLKAIKDCYVIMDFPGQAELYAHHEMIRNILQTLQKLDVRLCTCYLIDSHYANDPGKYMSAVMLTLSSMLQLELPTVNLLSKIDIVEKYGKLEFNLDFYTDVLDLDYLLDSLHTGPVMAKYASLNRAFADIICNYSLVSFIPVSVENRQSLINVMKAVDKANGYVYGSGEERNIQRLLSCAVGAEPSQEYGLFDSEEDMGEDCVHEQKVLDILASQNKDRN